MRDPQQSHHPGWQFFARSCREFLFKYYRHYRNLHSFPTRRSSDLRWCPAALALLGLPPRRGALRACHRRSEEHTSELQSHVNLVCRLLLEKKMRNLQSRAALIRGGEGIKMVSIKAVSVDHAPCEILSNRIIRDGNSSPDLAESFFLNITATTEIYTLSLHDALPICAGARRPWPCWGCLRAAEPCALATADRKSTRLNSSHMSISYAVFCLKKRCAISSLVPL